MNGEMNLVGRLTQMVVVLLDSKRLQKVEDLEDLPCNVPEEVEVKRDSLEERNLPCSLVGEVDNCLEEL
jgi:hypothetical protein